METPTLRERFRYHFDNLMSRGLAALMTLLSIASLALIAIVTLVVVIFGLHPAPDGRKENMGFWETLWASLLRTLDPGTMGADQGNGFRVAMLVVTIGGIIVVASLISIISSAFNTRIEELRRGRSRVLEKDHTLILGWSNKVFEIVNELCAAHESGGRGAIVVLADRDKVLTEDELRLKVRGNGRTRIIVRSGNPMDPSDLECVSPHTAKSVILLAPDESEDPDAVVIKMALALVNSPHRSTGQYRIVGEIQDPRNLEAARLVGGDEAEWIVTGDVISRITVQTSRQRGLSVVYTGLLAFSGSEFYLSRQPDLIGKTYFETQLAFETSCVVGMVIDGQTILNPPATTVYRDNDELILIAGDDSSIATTAPGSVDETKVRSSQPLQPEPERILILGYNSRLEMILSELDEYVARGSRAVVVAEVPMPRLPDCINLEVEFVRGDSTSRTVLDGLGVKDFDHVIVLAYQGLLNAHRADAKTLITLLHLRDMAVRMDIDLNVVSEMLDDRNRELAEVTQADDFIVSDKLIGLMLSQVSENRMLGRVFETMLTSVGSEIYLRPADDYIEPGTEVDFYTVLEAARRRGETAIGYRRSAQHKSVEHAYGVVINPKKSDLITLDADDSIIVFAEH